jgi:hypothetical protein
MIPIGRYTITRGYRSGCASGIPSKLFRICGACTWRDVCPKVRRINTLAPTRVVIGTQDVLRKELEG